MARRATQAAIEEFVLDASLALAWYFKDEADPHADKVAARLTSARAIVPAIWFLEVANALLMGERRRRSTEAQAGKWLAYLQLLPIVADEESPRRLGEEALTLARVHGLSAYDAAYLELSLRRGLPLASLDEKLNAAASALGVRSYRP